MSTVTKFSTKAEEMEAVEIIQAGIPKDAYLHSLFTDEFVQWVKNRIQEDIAPDLYEWYEAEMSKNTHLETQIGIRKEQAEKRAHEYDINVAVLNKNVEEVRRQLAEANESIQAWMNNYHRAIDKLEASEAEVHEQSQTIMELKAKLYDLMMKGE